MHLFPEKQPTQSQPYETGGVGGGHRLGGSAGRQGREETTPVMRQCKPLEGEDCTICLEGLTAESTPAMLKCKHAFHRACIVRWAKQKQSKGEGAQCPVCRKVFLPPGATLPW